MFEVVVSAEVARSSGTRRRKVQLSDGKQLVVEFSRVAKVFDFVPPEIRADKHLVAREISDADVRGRPVLRPVLRPVKPEAGQAPTTKGKKK
jgi:hypothetical protein